MESTPDPRPARITVCVLMSVATLTFVVASLVHFGVPVPLGMHDPFRDAAIPEAVIATILAAGVVGGLTRPAAAWPLALGTTLFALFGTFVGLAVTLRTSRGGDIAYHVSILVVLATTAGLLLAPWARRALRPVRS